MDLLVEARRTAAGMATAVADGREADSNALLRMYLADAMEGGQSPCTALVALAKASVGLAVGTSDRDVERFRAVALGLAAS